MNLFGRKKPPAETVPEHRVPDKQVDLHTPELVKARYRHAYRLVVALVTARDEPLTTRKLTQMAIDDMPQETCADTAAIAMMLSVAVGMLTEYVRGTAAAFDTIAGEGMFHKIHAAAIRHELMEDD